MTLYEAERGERVLAGSWLAAGVFTALAATISHAGLGPGGDDEPLHVMAQVLAEDTPRDGLEHKRAVQEIVRLGPEIVPLVFDALARHQIAPADEKTIGLDQADEAILIEALGAWPASDVLQTVALAAEGRSLSDRLLALRLYGATADLGAVEQIFEVLANFDQAELQYSLVRRELVQALVLVLRRDPYVHAALRGEVDRFEPRLLPSLAEALGEVGDGACLTLFRKLLGESEGLDLHILGALGQLRSWEDEVLNGDVADILRHNLLAQSAELRRQAALSIGHQRESAAFPDLVELLSDSDKRVRAAALWALQEITGLRWSGEVEPWLEYYYDERDWLESEYDDLMRALRGSDTFAGAEALRLVAGHPLHRREIAEDVVRYLGDANEPVTLGATGALARLGDASAVRPLIEMVETKKGPVRDSALVALRSLTGFDLGPDPQAWKAKLRL